MPTYEYRCNCGLRFEKVSSPKKVKDTQECPKCGKQADRYISGIHYSAQVSSSKEVAFAADTGISKIDEVTDQIIGRESEQGWETVEQRKSEKDTIMQENGLARDWQMARTPEGRYRPLSQDEQREFARRFVWQVTHQDDLNSGNFPK